jgi:excisionase family DNA binding protein
VGCDPRARIQSVHLILRKDDPLSTVPSGADPLLATPAYLDKKQAAQIVGLHWKTIERLITRGELQAFRLAGKIRIRPEDLHAWINTQRVGGPTIHSI